MLQTVLVVTDGMNKLKNVMNVLTNVKLVLKKKNVLFVPKIETLHQIVIAQLVNMILVTKKLSVKTVNHNVKLALVLLIIVLNVLETEPVLLIVNVQQVT
jgi:hypothetical protein